MTLNFHFLVYATGLNVLLSEARYLNSNLDSHFSSERPQTCEEDCVTSRSSALRTSQQIDLLLKLRVFFFCIFFLFYSCENSTKRTPLSRSITGWFNCL